MTILLASQLAIGRLQAAVVVSAANGVPSFNRSIGVSATLAILYLPLLINILVGFLVFGERKPIVRYRRSVIVVVVDRTAAVAVAAAFSLVIFIVER